MRTLHDAGETLRIRKHAGKALWGRIWLVLGLLAGIGAWLSYAAAPRASFGALLALEAVPLFCVAAGLVMMARDHVMVVDRRTGRIDGHLLHPDLEVADVCAVATSNAAEAVWVDDAEVPVAYWVVSLVRRSKAPQLAAAIDAIVRDSGGDPRDVAQRRHHQASALRRALPELFASIYTRVVVVESSTEAQAWQSAEQLAKALRVPMLDLSGSEPVLRPVAELDLSLPERVRRGYEGIGWSAGEPPSGVRCRSEGPDCVIEWRHFPAVITFLGIAVFAGMFVLMGFFIHGLELGYALATPVLIVMPLLPFGTGWSRLSVSNRVMRIRRGPLRLWGPTVPLERIEALRVTSHGAAGGLAVVTDQDVVRLAMSEQRSTWIARRLHEHFASNSARTRRG